MARQGFYAHVIEPGHGSCWISDAHFVDRFGKPNPRGRFIKGRVWDYQGGWNMPDDYRGEYLWVIFPRKWVLRTEE